MKKIIMIDAETGEIVGKKVADNLEDVSRKRKFVVQKKENKEFKEMQNEFLGNFVYMFTSKFEDLQKHLTNGELAKFILLGTYVKKDGYLKLDNNKTYITKSMLKDILNISRQAVNDIYNTLLEKNLIKEDEKGIKINLNYFYRGSEADLKKIKKRNNRISDFARIYTTTTRNLYKNTKKNDSDMFVTLYRLINFTNYKFNMICKNPTEQEFKNLEPLTINDIIKTFTFDSRKSKKFIQYILNISLGENRLLMREGTGIDIKNDILYVNPRLYYMGDNIDDLQDLIKRFDLHRIK